MKPLKCLLGEKRKTLLRHQPWLQGRPASDFTVLSHKHCHVTALQPSTDFKPGLSSLLCIFGCVGTFCPVPCGVSPCEGRGCCRPCHWLERPQQDASQDDPVFMAEITLSTAIKYLFLLIKFWSFPLIKYGSGRLLFQVPAFALLLRRRFWRCNPANYSPSKDFYANRPVNFTQERVCWIVPLSLGLQWKHNWPLAVMSTSKKIKKSDEIAWILASWYKLCRVRVGDGSSSRLKELNHFTVLDNS